MLLCQTNVKQPQGWNEDEQQLKRGKEVGLAEWRSKARGGPLKGVQALLGAEKLCVRSLNNTDPSLHLPVSFPPGLHSLNLFNGPFLICRASWVILDILTEITWRSTVQAGAEWMRCS